MVFNKLTNNPTKMTHLIENGHEFAHVIQGKSYNANYRDNRLSWRNAGLRSNIRDRDGSKLTINHKKINGYSYDKNLICATCEKILPRSQFENQTINKKHKKYIGFNIKCRKCSVSQYEKNGYKLEGFVTNTFQETVNRSETHKDEVYDNADDSEFDSEGDSDSECEYDSDSDSGCDSECDSECDCECEGECECKSKGDNGIYIDGGYEDKEYEIESIIGVSNENTYLVKWKGYSDEYNTWEPYENVKHVLHYFITV